MLTALLALLTGCAAESRQTSTCFSLGTVCTQTIYGGPALLEEGERLIFDADSRYSWRRAESELSAINRGAGGFVRVSQETFDLVALAQEMAERTGGAFDPTIGVLTKEWNISEDPKVPPRETVSALLGLVDYKEIQLDPETRSVKIGAGQFLDLGGIAKGAIADRLADFYRENGVKSGLLNLGGNMFVLGRKPDGRPYRIGIRDPLGDSGTYYCTLEAEDVSVVVSGAYERYFEQDGVTYHHILDSRTGYPADSDLLSVCILAENSAMADALSTAVFALGAEQGRELAESREEADWMLVTKDKKILMSEDFLEKYNVEWTQGMEYAP